MDDFLEDLVQFATPIFAISSMGSVGLSNTITAIIEPLRRWRVVVSALVGSFVVVPLLAWLVARLIDLDRPFETGLILVATGGGAPFVVQFVRVAGGNLALTAGVLVLLLVGTVIYMPLMLPRILGDEVDVDTAAIALTLTWSMLLPLVGGMAVRFWNKGWADRVRLILQPLATVALLALVLSTFIINFRPIFEILGEGAILAAFIVTSGAFAFGFMLGGRRQESRTVVGFATGQRNIAAATIVATRSFTDEQQVLVMVVVTSLVSMVVLFSAAFAVRRRTEATGAAQQIPV